MSQWHPRHSPFLSPSCFIVYYESMKRKLKIKPIYECRCDGRLQTKRFTRLSHTGFVEELEPLKIQTRLTNFVFICLLWIDEAKANIKPIYDCRCNGRLQTKRSSLRVSHTLGLLGWGLVVRKKQMVVYYESIKRELKIKSTYECRCDERLQTKTRKLRASDALGWPWNWNTYR